MRTMLWEPLVQPFDPGSPPAGLAGSVLRGGALEPDVHSVSVTEKWHRKSDTCTYAQVDTGELTCEDLSLSDGASIWDQCLFKLGITYWKSDLGNKKGGLWAALAKIGYARCSF